MTMKIQIAITLCISLIYAVHCVPLEKLMKRDVESG